MKQSIWEFITACQVCQQIKYLASSPQGLLQPLPIPEAVWEKVRMDFIVKLPKFNGFDVKMVVVDWLSKYEHFVLRKHLYYERVIAEIFMKVVKLHEIHVPIVRDRIRFS